MPLRLHHRVGGLGELGGELGLVLVVPDRDVGLGATDRLTQRLDAARLPDGGVRDHAGAELAVLADHDEHEPLPRVALLALGGLVALPEQDADDLGHELGLAVALGREGLGETLLLGLGDLVPVDDVHGLGGLETSLRCPPLPERLGGVHLGVGLRVHRVAGRPIEDQHVGLRVGLAVRQRLGGAELEAPLGHARGLERHAVVHDRREGGGSEADGHDDLEDRRDEGAVTVLRGLGVRVEEVFDSLREAVEAGDATGSQIGHSMSPFLSWKLLIDQQDTRYSTLSRVYSEVSMKNWPSSTWSTNSKTRCGPPIGVYVKVRTKVTPPK